jgi:hypothetical protein
MGRAGSDTADARSSQRIPAERWHTVVLHHALNTTPRELLGGGLLAARPSTSWSLRASAQRKVRRAWISSPAARPRPPGPIDRRRAHRGARRDRHQRGRGAGAAVQGSGALDGAARGRRVPERASLSLSLSLSLFTIHYRYRYRVQNIVTTKLGRDGARLAP